MALFPFSPSSSFSFRIHLLALTTLSSALFVVAVNGVDHAVQNVAVEVGATARLDCRTCSLAVNKLAVSITFFRNSLLRSISSFISFSHSLSITIFLNVFLFNNFLTVL